MTHWFLFNNEVYKVVNIFDLAEENCLIFPPWKRCFYLVELAYRYVITRQKSQIKSNKIKWNLMNNNIVCYFVVTVRWNFCFGLKSRFKTGFTARRIIDRRVERGMSDRTSQSGVLSISLIVVQPTLHDSLPTLVYWCQRSWWNLFIYLALIQAVSPSNRRRKMFFRF